MADWVTDGTPPFDMWEVDIARADPKAATTPHMQDRMQESVADLFALHWPYKQPQTGRGLRRSALHDHWANAGAVFGQTAGWERGLWYARDTTEASLPYSVDAQPWWPIAQREAAAMADGAVLLDLSPFTKIDITGDSVVDQLNHLTTSQMNIEIGLAIYTQILNPKGGIEMDVTLTRLGETQFHLTSGAATRQRDLGLSAQASERLHNH